MQQPQDKGRMRATLRRKAHRGARRQIDQALAAAHAVAMAELEAMARESLRNPSSGAHSFLIAMGSAAFYDKRGNPIDIQDERGRDRVWAHRLLQFLDDYGDSLGLWGTPLKLDSADAIAKTDW